MPIIVRKFNKMPAVNEILRLAQRWIYPNCSPASRETIAAHVKWMHEHQDDLIVACRFETNVDKRVTRIVFECSFVQQQPTG